MKLYHGIINDNLESMLENGIKPNSYWGSQLVALNHSDINKVIEINSEDYEIEANSTLIEYYKDNDPDDEAYQLWLESSQTWQDSLDIFDSVIIKDVVYFDDLNILSL